MEINGGLNIPDSEISFSYSRSSGPGGQHVNKVSTRVTLSFDVAHSPSLDERQRLMISRRLAQRINKEGVLLVTADSFRSQRGNREEALHRFVTLLRQALHQQRPRRKTRLPRRVKEQRLAAKKNRGRLKLMRSRTIRDND